MSFTNEQIQKSCKRFEKWSGKTLSEEYKQEFPKKLDIQIVRKTSLRWDELLDTDSKVWEDRFFETMSKVKYRLSY